MADPDQPDGPNRRSEAAPAKIPATPPKAKAKSGTSPRPAVTKAERAAQKRADKMVIKRMRKR